MNSPNDPTQIETERLTLRGWREEDRAAFAEMCADPRVMEFLTPLPTRADSDAYVDRVLSHWDSDGFGMFAMEEKATSAFAGFTGLKRVPFSAHFTPAVEIAWRMPVGFWGKGLATEAARACLEYGFTVLGLREIVAYTASSNARSEAVMLRLGMQNTPGDNFIFPDLPADHPFQPMLLYRQSAPEPHRSGGS